MVNTEYRFRILSLDGGGVRGLIPLTILQEIETKTGQPISQLFDLIVGNSTGGIIALCLAAETDNKPKYTAQEILELYYTRSAKIFDKSIFRSIYTGLGLWAPKYNRKYLDAVLNEFFGNLQLSQVSTDVIVTSYSLTKDSPNLWSSYAAKSISNQNILMADAAGATSAAPTYFAPKIIPYPDKSTSCELDGGIYANDPEELALMTAMSRNPGLSPNNVFIVSLGTGRPKLNQSRRKMKNSGIIGWFTQVNLIDLMINADTQFGEWELNSHPLLKRHRLQVELDAKNCAMDNTTPENLKSLLQAGHDFIQQSQDEITEICGSLTNIKNVSKGAEVSL